MQRIWLTLGIVGLLAACGGDSTGDGSGGDSGSTGSDDGTDGTSPDGGSGTDDTGGTGNTSSSGGTTTGDTGTTGGTGTGDTGTTSGGTTTGDTGTTTGDTTTDDTTTGDTGTTSGGVTCGDLDEQACQAAAGCFGLQGQQYVGSPNGTWCLDAMPVFVYCTPAGDPCLPATQTVCIGNDIYEAWSSCELPDGVTACDPPEGYVGPC